MKWSAKPFEPNAVHADDPAVVTAVDFVPQPRRSCRVPVGSRRFRCSNHDHSLDSLAPQTAAGILTSRYGLREGVSPTQTLGFPVGVPSYPAPMGVRAGTM
jgi:hypothetical protein